MSKIERSLERAFAEFTKKWGVDDVMLVNKKSPPGPGGERDWNIGLSANAAEIERRHIEELVTFLATLSGELNVGFSVGVSARNFGARTIGLVERTIPDGTVGTLLSELRAALE